jgi:hypothetical protein
MNPVLGYHLLEIGHLEVLRDPQQYVVVHGQGKRSPISASPDESLSSHKNAGLPEWIVFNEV